MKIGIETESFHLLFQYGKMNVLDFIRKAAEIGFEGVELNIIPGWGIDKALGQVGDDTVENLDAVRDEIRKHNLYVEIDTNGTSEADLKRALRVANHVGANVVRTYIKCSKFDAALYEETIQNFKNIVPELKKYRIRLALENHEYETSEELVELVKAVDSQWVGLLYDFGNSMMVWEEPVKAAEIMAPYTYGTHFKDHIIIEDKDAPYGYVVCGIPVGKGHIDLDKCFQIMVEKSPVERINLEMCFPYCATFKREPGTGGVNAVGEGTFKVEDAPYDRNIVKPLEYYYPHRAETITDEYLDKMMEDQFREAAESFKHLKALRDKYCSK